MKTMNYFKIACLVCMAFILSCSSELDEVVTSSKDENKDIKRYSYRTYEEAFKIAEESIALLDEVNETRSTSGRRIKDSHYILNNTATRTVNDIDTLMYIFNFEDNAGFAVVSTNPSTEELIAVTELGNYTSGEPTGNAGFDMYMQLAEEYIASTSLIPVDTTQIPLTEIKHVAVSDTIKRGPYITVQWGQKSPYNNEAPIVNGVNCPTGCVATTIAQILSYYQHPTSLTIDYETPSYVMDIQWETINMHKSNRYSQCLCTNPSVTHSLIAKLFRQIGEDVNMNYNLDGSGATDRYAKYALNKYGYTCDNFQQYQSAVVANSLLKRRLVYMSGVDEEENRGHAWIIDGYKEISTTMTTYVRPAGRVDWDILRVDNSVVSFNHINWGWSGICNGYFSPNVFNTAAANSYDPNVSTSASKNYTVDLNIYPNIQIQ